MIIPIRCWSCGKPLAQMWAPFKDRVTKGESRKKVLDDLGAERYCCRAMLMGHIDLVETIGQFKKA